MNRDERRKAQRAAPRPRPERSQQRAQEFADALQQRMLEKLTASDDQPSEELLEKLGDIEYQLDRIAAALERANTHREGGE